MSGSFDQNANPLAAGDGGVSLELKVEGISGAFGIKSFALYLALIPGVGVAIKNAEDADAAKPIMMEPQAELDSDREEFISKRLRIVGEMWEIGEPLDKFLTAGLISSYVNIYGANKANAQTFHEMAESINHPKLSGPEEWLYEFFTKISEGIDAQ